MHGLKLSSSPPQRWILRGRDVFGLLVKRAGFTLVELLVSATILAIVSLIAAQAFIGLNKGMLNDRRQTAAFNLFQDRIRRMKGMTLTEIRTSTTIFTLAGVIQPSVTIPSTIPLNRTPSLGRKYVSTPRSRR